MFSRFDAIPACDRQTDRQTDGRTDVQPIAITYFSIADARKMTFGLIEIIFSVAKQYNTLCYTAVMIVI